MFPLVDLKMIMTFNNWTSTTKMFEISIELDRMIPIDWPQNKNFNKYSFGRVLHTQVMGPISLI